MRVKLGEVAKESRQTLRGSKRGLPVVGLEHITPSELNLTSWDIDSDNTFAKAFHKGQMLFGRRRAYLRKAALAPFDGICSGDITVIEASSGKLLPELLPFIIQNDAFFDYAVGKSAGSLSPRAKWEHLQNFEFNLPPLGEQHRLAELFWAANATREAYKKLLVATDELIKSQFIEMFGDPVTNPLRWDTRRLDEIATTRLGKMLDEKKQTGENTYQYLANFNVQWFRFDLEKLKSMDFDEAERVEFSLQDGDLLVCEGGDVGRTAIWRNELQDCFFQKALHRVRCNLDICIPEYLAWVLYYKATVTHFDGIVNGVTIAHLTGEKLKGLKIQVPPLALQNRFTDFVQQADKSKVAVLQLINNNHFTLILNEYMAMGGSEYVY
jgi:type I restriction enzyme S subunit